MAHKSVVLLLLTTCLWACKAQRNQNNSSSSTSKQETTATLRADEQKPSILFLFMKLEKLEVGEKLTLDSIKRVPGKFKPNQKVHDDHHESLRLVFHDVGHTRSDTFWMEHPLHRHVEIPSEDGKISATTVHLREAETSLRVQEKPWYHTISIERINTDNTSLLLIKQQIE